MILESLIVGPIWTNCFVIGDEKTCEGTIIDPGGDPGEIMRVVKNTGLDIKFIIATHGHFDHISAINQLKKKLECDFLIHKDDLLFVRESKRAAKIWDFDIEQVPDPDKHVNEGDVLNLGAIELRILHTPGHSPGGISIYIQGEKVLFSGDTLFQSSIGRTDLPMGSMEDLARSIKNKLYALPEDTIVYTGHGTQTTIGEEKKYNSFVRG